MHPIQVWIKDAACAGQTELFFPGEHGGGLSAAKKLCAACPVQRQCEEYGRSMLNHEVPLYRGLWGGKTVTELRDQEQAEKALVPFVQGNCALAGCSSDVPPSGSNYPRIYCSFRCKKKAEHLRAASRAKELVP